MSERELAALQHKAIEKANQQKNPFSIVAEEYEKYTADDQELKVTFYSSKELTKDLKKFCLKLAEKNVGGYYKTCSLGWQPKVSCAIKE